MSVFVPFIAVNRTLFFWPGAVRVAGRLEQELREGGTVRVHATGRRECAQGGDGAQGGQEATDAAQPGVCAGVAPWLSNVRRTFMCYVCCRCRSDGNLVV